MVLLFQSDSGKSALNFGLIEVSAGVDFLMLAIGIVHELNLFVGDDLIENVVGHYRLALCATNVYKLDNINTNKTFNDLFFLIVI